MSKSKASQLLKAAKAVQRNAHAPYSHFFVGAALLDEQGRIHAGCNVENASYGGTICAERHAIGAMIAAGGKFWHEIVVVTDKEEGTSPCGLCRQVLLELCASSTSTIYIASTKKILASYSMAELLPHSFGPRDLGQ